MLFREDYKCNVEKSTKILIKTSKKKKKKRANIIVELWIVEERKFILSDFFGSKLFFSHVLKFISM